jgi:hypothetical protein
MGISISSFSEFARAPLECTRNQIRVNDEKYNVLPKVLLQLSVGKGLGLDSGRRV